MSEGPLVPDAVIAAVASSNMTRSEEFYEALLGRPVDQRPMPTLSQWQWGELTLQLVDDPERAGGGLVTVVVPDMSEAVAGMGSRGISVDVDEGTVVAKYAILNDPDGNAIYLVQSA